MRFRADLDRPIGQLSRGNRQKIGLISACFHEPELLVLDEPTGDLDPLMQQEFLALVAEERERGATVFLSSHDLSEVQRVCDRVGIVRGGRLIAIERIDALLGKARRRVTVELAGPADLQAELRALPGVADVEGDGRRFTLIVGGDVDALLKVLAVHHVSDLEVAAPSLEEVFLSYYQEEGGEMSAQLAALVSTHFSDRRRSVLAWGLPLGMMSVFIVAIFPSVQEPIAKAVQSYPSGLKEAFGIG